MTDQSYRDPPSTQTRADTFDEFWAGVLSALESGATPPREILQDQRKSGYLLTQLRFRSLDNVWIWSYFLRPENSHGVPLVIHTHGYNSEADIMWRWAERGCAVFGFDVRGFGRSRSDTLPIAADGYVLTGIDHPETSILRGAVADYLQAIRVAAGLSPERPAITVLYGRSFAGALAAMAQALSHAGDFLVCAVPTFGWARGRRLLSNAGSSGEINAYLRTYPERENNVLHTLSFFDPVNHADAIRCPVLGGIGVEDPVVPAATTYAIFNQLHCPHELREFPCSHTLQPEESLWTHYEREWLDYTMHGLPEEFGQPVTGSRGPVIKLDAVCR